VLGEEQDVLTPLAKGREVDGEDGEAIVEILAEPALGHCAVQIAVGGGEEADVGVERRGAADTLVLALLEDAEQLGLHGEGKLADLVQEEGAAGGELEAAALESVRAGEGAALVPEELGFDERLGQGGAVEGDEWTVGTRAGVVDGAGQHLLPGAGLAAEQHGRVRGRNLARLVDGRGEARRLSDDRIESEPGRDGGREGRDPSLEPGRPRVDGPRPVGLGQPPIVKGDGTPAAGVPVWPLGLRKRLVGDAHHLTVPLSGPSRRLPRNPCHHRFSDASRLQRALDER
jgi:hypothetical protein